MIQPATALTPTPPTGRIKSAPGTAAPEAFAVSLTAFLDTGLPNDDMPAPVSGKVGERQADADGGKSLPDDGDAAAPAFAWVPPPIPMPAISIPAEPDVAPAAIMQPTVAAATGSSASTTLPAVQVAGEPVAGLQPASRTDSPSPVVSGDVGKTSMEAPQDLSLEPGQADSGLGTDGVGAKPPVQPKPVPTTVATAAPASVALSTIAMAATPTIASTPTANLPLPPANATVQSPLVQPTIAQSVSAAPLPAAPSPTPQPIVATAATVSAQQIAPPADTPSIAPRSDLPVTLVQPAAPGLATQPQPGMVAPALHIFGAAISAAREQDDRATVKAADAVPIGIAATGIDTHRHAVTATAEAQQAPLDMRQDRWPSAMIDRIEQLRDSADANDTRIRLVPDALGAIDVSVKRDGDSVHVHFNAEQAATRTLIADAQPRLAELAEQRGLKLTQSSVDAGTSGNGQQRGAFQQSPVPAAPPRATRDDATDPTDTRIA